jgi:uncharacterized phage-associated protein
MHDALTVAWRMLQVAKAKGIQMSNLKLQKLIYIAHGYLLGWKGQPLVSEEIEAWNYGPVVNSIYHQFKNFGDSLISIDDSIQLPPLGADEEAVIDGVLNLYGYKSAIELVNLTHQVNTPWYEVWNNGGGRHFYAVPIKNDLIINHYRNVISNPNMVSGL